MENIGAVENYTCRKKKEVCQFNLNGDYIATFPSTSAASRETNAAPSAISRCCHLRKDRLTAGGFQWRFRSEVS